MSSNTQSVSLLSARRRQRRRQRRRRKKWEEVATTITQKKKRPDSRIIPRRNPIFDQAVENAKKTETEMENWIANATNTSVTFIDEVVSAIEDVATSGHFNVSSSSSSDETNEDSTTTVVPVVQELQNDEETEKKFEILRNVPEFRYRSSLGGASTSDFLGE